MKGERKNPTNVREAPPVAPTLRPEGKSASQRKTTLGSCKLHCKPSAARGQILSTTQIKSRLI